MLLNKEEQLKKFMQICYGVDDQLVFDSYLLPSLKNIPKHGDHDPMKFEISFINKTIRMILNYSSVSNRTYHHLQWNNFIEECYEFFKQKAQYILSEEYFLLEQSKIKPKINCIANRLAKAEIDKISNS